MKRPAGSVLRLLKQLENGKDEKEIISNLKNANKFEDYEHLLVLEAEEENDDDDVVIEENFNAQEIGENYI